MNLLEHYIVEVLEVTDLSSERPDMFDGVDEPIYIVKMIVNCYGNRETVEALWLKSQYETYIERGYYLA